MRAELRAQLWARSNGYCEVCGFPMSQTAWAAHHRQLQRRVDVIWNLLAIHHACHNGATGSVHLSPAKAMEAGYIVRQSDDPVSVPILLHGKHRMLLNERGGYTPIPKETDHE